MTGAQTGHGNSECWLFEKLYTFFFFFVSLENIYAPVSVAGASDWTDQHRQKINYTAKFRKTQGGILLLTNDTINYAKSKWHRRFNVACQTERRQFRPYFDYKLKKANQLLYYWFVNYLISLFIFHVCLEIFKIKKKEKKSGVMSYFIVSYFNPAPIDGHRLQNRTVWLETMLKIKKINKHRPTKMLRLYPDIST